MTDILGQVKSELAGVGLEVGTGYATDLATYGLLNPATIAATGGLSILGYGAANFTSGALSNYAAQRLRGEEEISWGELISSGLIDIIPIFGQKMKGAKGITNVALQSGARTVAQRQGQEALDEQRWLTPRETLESAVIGGAFGGMFKGVGQGRAYWKAKYKKFDLEEAREIFPSGVVQELINQGRIHKIPKEARYMATERIQDEIGYSGNIEIDKRLTTLRPQGPYRFLGKRKASAQMVTDPTGKKGYRVTPEVEKAFLDEGVKQSAERAKAFGYDLGKMEAHHTALLRQLFESLNGLDDYFINRGARFYERELGFKIGWDIEDALSIPQPWHPRLHSLINSRIASRSNAWDLGGIEKKFNLPPDWQKTLEYQDRIPIFREIASVIKQSIKDTELLYKGLNSRTLKSGKLSKEDYINLAFDLTELDNRLRGLKSPGFMVKEGSEGLETASDIINHILKNADRVDLTLPSFKKLNVNQTKAVAKVLLQENGAKALYEAIISGQSADTIFRANKILFTENNRIWKRILVKLDPDDLHKSGVSIGDVDTHIRTGWAGKTKSSLKAMNLPPRKDYTVEQLRDLGRSDAEIQELMDAGWVREN